LIDLFIFLRVFIQRESINAYNSNGLVVEIILIILHRYRRHEMIPGYWTISPLQQ